MTELERFIWRHFADAAGANHERAMDDYTNDSVAQLLSNRALDGGHLLVGAQDRGHSAIVYAEEFRGREAIARSFAMASSWIGDQLGELTADSLRTELYLDERAQRAVMLVQVVDAEQRIAILGTETWTVHGNKIVNQVTHIQDVRPHEAPTS